MSKRPADEPLVAAGVPKAARENGGQEAGAQARIRREKMPVISYRDSEPLLGLAEFYRSSGGQDVEVEVLISPEFLAKDNKRVKSRQIWGDKLYTADSDLVAVLMHLGYYTSSLAHAPQAIVEAHAVIRLTAPLASYPSRHRFVKSRAWSQPTPQGCAYTVERFWLVTRNGTLVELSRSVDELPALTPTVQPQSSDRYITTRNTGSKSKAAQDVSVQYNLCNEPWLKYTLAAVADKGVRPSQLTSARLLDNVLFLETASKRYQIARIGPLPPANAPVDEASLTKDQYSFSLCKTPLPASVMQKQGLPLPASHLDVIEASVEWEELQWGPSELHLKGKSYPLKRIHFMRTCKGEDSTGTAAGPAA